MIEITISQQVSHQEVILEYQYVKIERDDHIATVTFDRPEKLNALNIGLLTEIIDLSEGFSQDEQTRVIIFTGAGKDFSVGIDLTDPELMKRIGEGTMLMKSRFLEIGPKVVRKIYELNQITIAAVNGYALGGGACIAAACDFRIGSDNCKIGYPEVNLGMNLSWRALPMCVSLIGPARAKRMIMRGRKESAETLLDWGYLDMTVPEKKLAAASKKMAAEYASKPPLAAQMIKKSINAVSSAMSQSIMHMDSDQFQLAIGSRDFSEGLQAFMEKRKPDFKGD
jgi:enoyl-CoA hydratase